MSQITLKPKKNNQTNQDSVMLRQNGYTLVFPPELISLLKEHKKAINRLKEHKNDNDFLFTTKKTFTKPIHRTTLTKELNKTLALIKTPYSIKLTTHNFRSTFATIALKNSFLSDVQSKLNHKSSLTTACYSSLIEH
jgi:integrase